LDDSSVVNDLIENLLLRNRCGDLTLHEEVFSLVEPIVNSVVINLEECCLYLEFVGTVLNDALNEVINNFG